MIHDHWFRADHTDEPCKFSECGKACEEHVEACGEWRDPKHFHLPFWGGCARCGRPWGHSTHWGSRKNRSLWIRPKLTEALFWIKDKPFRSERCRHFSHRLKLPCFRPLISCSGLCEVHYDDCREGCP